MRDTPSPRSLAKVHMVLFGMLNRYTSQTVLACPLTLVRHSAATNSQTSEGVAIKKVTNVFSKKILAKRALREIKLLQHFRGHRNVCRCLQL